MIVVCLVILTLQVVHLIPESYAAHRPASAPCSNEIWLNYDRSINVRVIEMAPEVKISTPMSGLPVQIKDIGTYDELKVQVTNSYINTKSY